MIFLHPHANYISDQKRTKYEDFENRRPKYDNFLEKEVCSVFTRGGKNVITTKTFLQFDLTIKNDLTRTELFANHDITTSEEVTIK